MGRGRPRRGRRDRDPELRSLPGGAHALRTADRGAPDRVHRATDRRRRGLRSLSRPSTGERNRSTHRRPNPPAPLLPDHQDLLGKAAAMTDDVIITPSENGPYIVSGPVHLVAPDGHEI